MSGYSAPKPVQTFGQCGFGAELLAAIIKAGYKAPTPIQAQALPAILSGRQAELGFGEAGILPLLSIRGQSEAASPHLTGAARAALTANPPSLWQGRSGHGQNGQRQDGSLCAAIPRAHHGPEGAGEGGRAHRGGAGPHPRAGRADLQGNTCAGWGGGGAWAEPAMCAHGMVGGWVCAEMRGVCRRPGHAPARHVTGRQQRPCRAPGTSPAERFAKVYNLQICPGFGGVSKHQQFKMLKAGCEVRRFFLSRCRPGELPPCFGTCQSACAQWQLHEARRCSDHRKQVMQVLSTSPLDFTRS